MPPNLKQCIRRALDGKRQDFPNAIEGRYERKWRVHIATRHRAVEHGGGALGRTD